MGLHHHHDHHHKEGTKNIKTAFVLNVTFTVIEIVGGILTNSVAILSDALHDLGDSLSLGLSWYLEKYSQKKRDSHYNYGYGRFSLLSALINAMVLIMGSIWVLSETIPRLFNPVQPHTNGMLILAILGVIFNGAAVLKLRKGETMNEKMVGWHLWEDVLGWIGVLLISLIMKFFHAPVLDGVFSLAFTLFILYNVVRNLRQTLKIFLQAKPEGIDLSVLIHKIHDIPNIISSHDVRVWSMDGKQLVMTLHVVVPDDISKSAIVVIKNHVAQIAFKQGITHVTTEIEYEDEACDLVPV